MRRTTVGALAAGIAAAGLVAPFLDTSPGWTPVERGLREAPAAMLPATVSTAQPVRVVTTALDDQGRPVTTTRTATDRPSAERLIRAGRTTPNAVAVELDAPTYLLGSDTYRAQQWAPTTIRATSAWATSTGAGVTVAVIDSGVDAAHPDLAGQVLPGIDLVSGTAGTSSDPNGHGTHVAGTIGALTGNDLGVAGIAPGVKILPVRTQNANGSGTMSAVATGITWAADHGARVINMSLGSTVRVTAVTNAIAYARSKGVVVVASAGNSREQGSPVMYPAADPGVIAVAATGADDRVASFSNAGSYVDVAAPGISILNTIPVAKGSYAYYSGTSMASPHVAALAALIGAYRPGLTPDQVEQAMEISAVDLGAAGRDADYGYGRVDAVAALAAAGPASSAPAATPTRTATTTPTVAPTQTTTTPAPAPTPTTTAPPPAPTPTPTRSTTVKVSPVITSDGRSRTVTYGATVTTTFTVTAGGAAFAGKPARLCLAERAATTLTCHSVTTSATGTVVLKRTVTAPYRVALTVPATTTNQAATSPTYAYTVRATATLAARNATTLVAAVNGVNGQLVQLQRQAGSRWTTVKTFRAASSTTLSRTARGTYRMVVPDTASIIGVATRAVAL